MARPAVCGRLGTLMGVLVLLAGPGLCRHVTIDDHLDSAEDSVAGIGGDVGQTNALLVDDTGDSYEWEYEADYEDYINDLINEETHSQDFEGGRIQLDVETENNEGNSIEVEDEEEEEDDTEESDYDEEESVVQVPEDEDIDVDVDYDGSDEEDFHPVSVPTEFENYDILQVDGLVTLEELVNVTGARLNSKKAFAAADRNGDGFLSFEEFYTAPLALDGTGYVPGENEESEDL